MGQEDIIAQAATATQNQTPTSPPLTTFGPTPLVPPPPPVRFQPPQINIPTGPFQSVNERKRADRAALYHGIAQLIQNGTKYVQDKKMRSLTIDLNALMGAQQGYNEAQQTLQQDPNNEQAKKQLQHNASIINTITSDPKKLKQLQKAFDIDLFGTKNGKNKTENQALITAWQQFQQKQQAGDKSSLNPAAQRLMQSQPWRQQATPEAVAQAQAVKEGLLPKAGEILKAYQENYKTLMQAKSSEDRTAAITQRNAIIKNSAELIASAKNKQTEAYLQNALLRGMTEEDRFRTMTQIANIHAAETDKRIGALKDIAQGKNQVLEDAIKEKGREANDKNTTMQQRVQAMQEKNKLEGYRNVAGSLQKQLDIYNNTYKNLASENEKMQTELDKKGTSILGIKISAASGPDAKAMRTKIMVNQKLMQDIQGNMDMLHNRIQQMGQIDPSLFMQDQPALQPGMSKDTAVPFTPDTDTGTTDNSDESEPE